MAYESGLGVFFVVFEFFISCSHVRLILDFPPSEAERKTLNRRLPFDPGTGSDRHPLLFVPPHPLRVKWGLL